METNSPITLTLTPDEWRVVFFLAGRGLLDLCECGDVRNQHRLPEFREVFKKLLWALPSYSTLTQADIDTITNQALAAERPPGGENK